MYSRIWQSLTRVHPTITDIEQQRQSRLLAGLQIAMMLSTTFGLVVQFMIGHYVDWLGLTAILIVATFYVANRRGHYQISAILTVLNHFMVIHAGAVIDNSPIWFLFASTIVILGAIFISYRLTLAVAVASIIFQLAFGTLNPTAIEISYIAPLTVFIFTGSMVLVFMHHRTKLEEERQQELITANLRLRESEIRLEEQVTARTRDLQVAAQVSAQITTVLDLAELLPRIVRLTKEGFELYHTSVFLFDEETRELRYEAGTDEAGSNLKARNKKFSIDDKGVVPRAARTLQPVKVGDVTSVPDYYQEPALLNTRSELAVPMFIGNSLIGVLDLHSEKIDRFTNDDMVVMQPLAEQIAIAVQNARLYAYQREVAEKLRAVDDMKSQFLASMSHELRTPLNAILSFSKFIKMGIYGEANEQQIDASQKIISSADHLLSLINDVLDITKIESGMMQLFVEDDIELNEELGTVVSTAQAIVQNKDVKIVADIDANLPMMVGDRRRIRQVFLNIVSNACKFTETGTITISAKRKGDDLLFAVIDTGPGISAENLDIIFEPFQQTQTGVKHAGGTGLGLPISKKLVEAHEGRLWVETEIGTGSSFLVLLPIQSETLRGTIELPEIMGV